MGDNSNDVERIRKSGSRSRAMEMWRRQLEQDAEKAIQNVATGPASTSEPVAGPNDLAKVEDRKDSAFAKQRFADRYEQGLADHSAKLRDGDAIANDIQNDGEARAGRHLRLRERANPQQPTQDLMATLASQRKAGVRARQQVAKKGASKNSNGFGHLPHPGMWKAQPIQAKTAPIKAQVPLHRVDAKPSQIAFN